MRILIVSWAWPPVGRIGSMRPLGMAREWGDAGHEVHVLTGPGDRGGDATHDLEPLSVRSGARVHRAAAPGLRPAPDGTAHSLREAVVPPRWRQILSQWRTFPDWQRSWVGPATELGRALHSEQRFDVVWSTSPPESAHFVARHLARAGVPWVADFRDQWSEYLLARWDPVSRWIIDRISTRVLAPARRVTANAEGVARSIAAGSGCSVVCVRNGFDPFPPPAGPVQDRTLGYFGRIDPLFQHPERLWDPLRELRSRGRAWRLELWMTPGGGGGARVSVPDDLGDLVTLRPGLAHPDALARMQTMAALLVLAWEVRGGESTVAGKLYEYIGSRRPVLVCAPPCFEARQLVESSGTGLGAWSGPEIAAALSQLERFEPSTEGRSALDRAATAAQLLRVLEGARAGHVG
jgi:hypothetical protein